MKNYTLTLKGTKKNNTPDLEVEIKAVNKGQAFSMAFYFFEKGEYNSSTAFPKGKLTDFIPEAKNLDLYVGKYFVPSTAIKVVK